MNTRSIEQAHDADLRLSIVALRRAAQRAREIAQRTQTDLIVIENGELRHIPPALVSDSLRYRVQDKD
ncbi:MAG: hypothetical protein ACREPT_08950 [Rudaea sp.]